MSENVDYTFQPSQTSQSSYVPMPNYQPSTYAYFSHGLSPQDLEKIRAIVAEEIARALAPEERPSATIEYVQDGKRWCGTVYLVEEDV